MDDVMVSMRALHFIAMVSLAGAIFYSLLILEPALRTAEHTDAFAVRVRSRLIRIVYSSFFIGTLSAAGWLIWLARGLTRLPLSEVLAGPPLIEVLWETDFGQIWAGRLVLFVLLAGLLALGASYKHQLQCWTGVSAAILSATLVGSLAWAGHAAANMGSDLKGTLHLVGDILHLLAASAWLGALIPLWITLSMKSDDESLSVAVAATMRFSTVGIVSVITILITGINNTWVLAGSIRALTTTDYGYLLLVKIGLFFLLLAVAAVNRLVLTPRLARQYSPTARLHALGQLRRNVLIEVIVGIAILLIVAVLGTMSPETEDVI